MNSWKDLLSALRAKCAYEGDGSLADVQKFIADSDGAIEIALPKGENIEQFHARTTKTKKVRLVVESEEADDEFDDAGDSQKKGRTIVGSVSTDTPVDAKTFRRITEHKAYDRRAARGKTVFACAEDNMTFGAFLKATARMASREDREILQKANIGTNFTTGGALVPDTFIPTLISLKEERGVARTIVSSQPIPRDTATLPKRTGGLTVYAPGEGGSITESNVAVTQANVTAVGMKILTTCSNELLNDSGVSYIDFVTQEIAYAFADKEDECLINGDETSTYFSVNGLRNSLKGLSGTIANIAGLFVGSGNAYSELVLTDFEGVEGLLPAYVKDPKWVVHKRFWATVMQKLALAAGGVTSMEIAGGIKVPAFLGYPVIVSQVMPRVEGNSQVCALLGDYNMATILADVKGGMTIATSEHAGFSTDTLAIRATQRVAIDVHSPGNASATEASRIPGPYVGLITAAS